MEPPLRQTEPVEITRPRFVSQGPWRSFVFEVLIAPLDFNGRRKPRSYSKLEMSGSCPSETKEAVTIPNFVKALQLTWLGPAQGFV